MANSSSGQIAIQLYMLLNCSYEDEVSDVCLTHITNLNNIDYNEHLFYMNDFLYDYNYK